MTRSEYRTEHAATLGDTQDSHEPEALARYLACARSGEWGWRSEYDGSVAGSPAYLAGHYCMLLDDLIEAVGGVEAVTRLLLARAAAKEALNARDSVAEDE